MERKSIIALAGMVLAISTAPTAVHSPIRMNSIGVVTPKTCSAATTMVPATMKAALSTLTPAMTRARLVGAGPGLHRRKRRHDVEAAGDRKPGEIDQHAQPEAGGKHLADALWRQRKRRAERGPAEIDARRSPSRTAPTSVGRMTMRPADRHAARPEPTATAIENTARNAVTTSSVPPSTVFTSGGSSDITTAPTSQNQLVTSAPHHSRRSERR